MLCTVCLYNFAYNTQSVCEGDSLPVNIAFYIKLEFPVFECTYICDVFRCSYLHILRVRSLGYGCSDPNRKSQCNRLFRL